MLGLLYTAESVGTLARDADQRLDDAVPSSRSGRRARLDVLGRGDRARRPRAERLGRHRVPDVRRRGGHDQRDLPDDHLEPDHPRRAARAGWPASRCCRTPSARWADRPGPGWSPTPTSVRASIVSGGLLCMAGVAGTAVWLRDFWRYDAQTDVHALAERQARQLAGERADQVEPGSKAVGAQFRWNSLNMPMSRMGSFRRPCTARSREPGTGPARPVLPHEAVSGVMMSVSSSGPSKNVGLVGTHQRILDVLVGRGLLDLVQHDEVGLRRVVGGLHPPLVRVVLRSRPRVGATRDRLHPEPPVGRRQRSLLVAALGGQRVNLSPFSTKYLSALSMSTPHQLGLAPLAGTTIPP